LGVWLRLPPYLQLGGRFTAAWLNLAAFNPLWWDGGANGLRDLALGGAVRPVSPGATNHMLLQLLGSKRLCDPADLAKLTELGSALPFFGKPRRHYGAKQGQQWA